MASLDRIDGLTAEELRALESLDLSRRAQPHQLEVRELRPGQKLGEPAAVAHVLSDRVDEERVPPPERGPPALAVVGPERLLVPDPRDRPPPQPAQAHVQR